MFCYQFLKTFSQGIRSVANFLSFINSLISLSYSCKWLKNLVRQQMSFQFSPTLSKPILTLLNYLPEILGPLSNILKIADTN